jgi:hypothetical protein
MSHKDHAVSELHSLTGKLPAKVDAPLLPDDPFGRKFKMVWPSGGVRAVIKWLVVSVLCGFGLWLFEFASAKKKSTTPQLDQPFSSPSSLFRKAEPFFWVSYILFPFFTGFWQAYDSLPNEHYRPQVHTLIASHEDCNDQGCHSIKDSWQDKKTGETYWREDFADHRHSEAFRMALTYLAYGSVGCFAFALFRNLNNQGRFFDYLGKAYFVNVAFAALSFISTW